VLAGLVPGVDGEIFNVVDDERMTSAAFLRAYKRRVRRFTSVRLPYFVAGALSRVWEAYPLAPAFVTTAVLAVIATAGTMLLTPAAAYAFHFLKFPFRRLLLIIIINAFVLPQQVVIIPLFQLWRDLGLIDNFLYPLLMKNKLSMHTVPVFIAAMGGLLVFGATGIVLGPLVLAVAIALLDVWRRRMQLHEIEIGVNDESPR